MKSSFCILFACLTLITVRSTAMEMPFRYCAKNHTVGYNETHVLCSEQAPVAKDGSVVDPLSVALGAFSILYADYLRSKSLKVIEKIQERDRNASQRKLEAELGLSKVAFFGTMGEFIVVALQGKFTGAGFLLSLIKWHKTIDKVEASHDVAVDFGFRAWIGAKSRKIREFFCVTTEDLVDVELL